MKLRLSNHAPWCGTVAADIDYEADNQAGGIESPIEPACQRAVVVVGVLGVLEGLVGARQHGLEVAKKGVDPLEVATSLGAPAGQ